MVWRGKARKPGAISQDRVDNAGEQLHLTPGQQRRSFLVSEVSLYTAGQKQQGGSGQQRRSPRRWWVSDISCGGLGRGANLQATAFFGPERTSPSNHKFDHSNLAIQIGLADEGQETWSNPPRQSRRGGDPSRAIRHLSNPRIEAWRQGGNQSSVQEVIQV